MKTTINSDKFGLPNNVLRDQADQADLAEAFAEADAVGGLVFRCPEGGGFTVCHADGAGIPDLPDHEVGSWLAAGGWRAELAAEVLRAGASDPVAWRGCYAVCVPGADQGEAEEAAGES